ncbi:JAB domain-containing protein [uncultured Sphaerochaeta sp.]|uniref:JAB domain-containing protein n=1 Tax=uncultured Sphaerochaeta sp. TaxID=886478 RepID=UPI0029C9F405|nr:JAB domain-containing protein [uncultured Sphaerochaeta sp.]
MRSDIVKRYEKMRKQDLIEVLVNLSVKERFSISVPKDSLGELRRCLTPSEIIEKEHFIVLTLNGANKTIDSHIISSGLVNKTLVHPREVFRPAILDNATSIIIAHNHPSGNTTPSPEDMGITQRICQAGDLIGIRVLDHIIFTNEGHLSMMENNMLGGEINERILL